jgi:hypothetical protein
MTFQLWSKGDLRRDEPHTGQGTLYSTSNMLDGIRTFADLGCNVGYFTCWLCQQLKSTQLKGMMVDAHADATRMPGGTLPPPTRAMCMYCMAWLGRVGRGQASFFMHTSSLFQPQSRRIFP